MPVETQRGGSTYAAAWGQKPLEPTVRNRHSATHLELKEGKRKMAELFDYNDELKRTVEYHPRGTHWVGSETSAQVDGVDTVGYMRSAEWYQHQKWCWY